MARESELENLRAEIDEIDGDLLRLLERRGQLVLTIFNLKERLGLPLRLPDREAQILTAIAARSAGPFSSETIRHLFREIVTASQELMKRRTGA